MQIKRQSISHRLSASLPPAQRQNLISERLNASHDTFLSHLGSFIGRLHLQSQSSSDLIAARSFLICDVEYKLLSVGNLNKTNGQQESLVNSMQSCC